MSKKFIAPLLAAALLLSLSALAFADTIHLKDGSVIRGQVVGFKDQQFTVLIGNGARGGRRSRVTLYMEDVESIEFDSATGAAVAAITNDDNNNSPNDNPAPINTTQNPRPVQTQPDNNNNASNTGGNSSQPTLGTRPPTGNAPPAFVRIPVRVRGDNTANGWISSGFTVRRGQRLRITATGRVVLGGGRYSTPGGIATLPDRDKLMKTEPTGGLIAVIGDDNDDFIFIGAQREIVAQRDGILFLGVNEGNLNDNTGAYDVVIEAETVR